MMECRGLHDWAGAMVHIRLQMWKLLKLSAVIKPNLLQTQEPKAPSPKHIDTGSPSLKGQTQRRKTKLTRAKNKPRLA